MCEQAQGCVQLERVVHGYSAVSRKGLESSPNHTFHIVSTILRIPKYPMPMKQDELGLIRTSTICLGVLASGDMFDRFPALLLPCLSLVFHTLAIPERDFKDREDHSGAVAMWKLCLHPSILPYAENTFLQLEAIYAQEFQAPFEGKLIARSRNLVVQSVVALLGHLGQVEKGLLSFLSPVFRDVQIMVWTMDGFKELSNSGWCSRPYYTLIPSWSRCWMF